MGACSGDCIRLEPELIAPASGAMDRREQSKFEELDLSLRSVREVNELLHRSTAGDFIIRNPRGLHAIGCGLDGPLNVMVDGHAGYYCAGMNKHAAVTVNGNAGTGLAENMMSGRVHVRGDASQSAGATACGGLLIIDGNASARCGISLRGLDIVVKGSVGHMSAFMAQAGHLVVVGDAGEALGDSIYEAKLFVRGNVKSLGADCVEKPLRDEHMTKLRGLLDAAGLGGEVNVSEFKRYGSARRLYNFHIDNLGSY
jgi:glutamate synthase domain-containing protein 3